MTNRLNGISSMATRKVLADLSLAIRQASGIDAGFESVGGVDAAKRVAAGEKFDVVVLASDAIDRLIASGHVIAASKTDLVHSGVALAVRAGTRKPDVATEEKLKQAVLSARNIGYSTGPSGTALLKLFERWGIDEEMKSRCIQAPAGVPVATLVAEGKVELGFQQLSELAGMPGIEVVGMMPAGCEITTTFSAGICAVSQHSDQVYAYLAHLKSPALAGVKRQHHMEPA